MEFDLKTRCIYSYGSGLLNETEVNLEKKFHRRQLTNTNLMRNTANVKNDMDMRAPSEDGNSTWPRPVSRARRGERSSSGQVRST